MTPRAAPQRPKVRLLLVKIAVPRPIGIECHESSIGRPDWKQVSACIEREAGGTPGVEEPDIGIALHGPMGGYSVPVRRQYWIDKFIFVGRAERTDGCAGAVEPGQLSTAGSYGPIGNDAIA